MIVAFQHGLSYLQHYLHGTSFTVSLLVLLALGLALCFAGRVLIKGLAFIITGIALGIIGAALGAAFLGILGLVIGGTVGFIAGGFLGMLVVKLGVGIALGYLGYSASTGMISSQFISIVIGIVLFVVGVALANYLLSVGTAVVGGLLIFQVMTGLGFGFVLAAAAAVVIGAIGAAVQLIGESHAKTRTVTTTQTVQTA